MTSPIADIEALDRESCIVNWEKLTSLRVPKRLSTEFMRRALAYEQQCKAYGGLSSATRKTLTAVAAGKSVAEASRPALPSGAHLVREWNGRTYQVKVGDLDFEMDGRRYRSLSAIARKITGARWSGPRFFGLSKRSAARLGTQS